MPTNLA
jgi:hypothetical protein